MSGTVEKKGRLWERAELDWYQEPTRATEQLLTVERFDGLVLDPCCGGGNIVTTMRAAGIDAHGTDIVNRVGDPDNESTWPRWFCGTQDFLRRRRLAPFANLAMNPPFFRAKGAEAFIRHGLALKPKKMAAFVDIRFLAGAQRASGLFADHPPSRIWIVTPRVSCPPGSYLAAGNKAGNGSSDWVWLIWCRLSQPGTRMGWLRLAGVADDEAEAA